MSDRKLSRRQFLWAAGGVLAAGLAPRGGAVEARLKAPPPPATPTLMPTTDEPREYFVLLEDYHELPPECYEPDLICPLEIILHSDGNRKGRDLWVVQITYDTLKYLKHSAHFAVDQTRVWQLLPMYRTVVQESHGAKGYNWEAINVEMAGVDFDAPDNYPPEDEIRRTVHLISQLMDFYNIPFRSVVGHYERDERGIKTDPGEKFMADFRKRLRAYRARLSPFRKMLIANP